MWIKKKEYKNLVDYGEVLKNDKEYLKNELKEQGNIKKSLTKEVENLLRENHSLTKEMEKDCDTNNSNKFSYIEYPIEFIFLLSLFLNENEVQKEKGINKFSHSYYKTKVGENIREGNFCVSLREPKSNRFILFQFELKYWDWFIIDFKDRMEDYDEYGIPSHNLLDIFTRRTLMEKKTKEFKNERVDP